jgi:DsbC/DsbD-like thiol-disulfide interchange protein
MLRWLFLILALLAAPAFAAPNHIVPEVVAEGPASPGGEVELAVVMHTEPGWHGYWRNPGDAGLGPTFDWQLPPGASLGPLRFPVPSRNCKKRWTLRRSSADAARSFISTRILGYV